MGAEQSRMAGEGHGRVPSSSPIASKPGAGPSANTNTQASASISRGMRGDTTVLNPSLSSSVSTTEVVPEAAPVMDIATPRASTNLAFRFQDLHVDTLRKIISHVFALEGLDGPFVWPFYRQGMLAGYIRVGEGDEAVHDNVNLQLLQVNKLFRDVGSQVFYGGRTFIFNEPVLCSWWTKHIGPTNFSNVRSLTVNIRSGFKVDLDERSAIDQTYEEEWFGFFCWLKDRHQLEAMQVELCDWQDVHDIRARREWCARPVELEMDEKEEILEWRRKLRGKISLLRGLKYAAITDHTGSALTSTDCDELCKLMTQKRGTLPPPPDPRKMSLAEVLRRVRLNSQQDGAGGLPPILEEDEEELYEQEEEEQRRLLRHLLEMEEEQRRKGALEAEEKGEDDEKDHGKSKQVEQQDMTLHRSTLDSASTANANPGAGGWNTEAPPQAQAPPLPLTSAPADGAATPIWNFGGLPLQASKRDEAKQEERTDSPGDDHRDLMLD